MKPIDLDDRLRAAFGPPPVFKEIVARVRRTPRQRFGLFALAASLIVGATLAIALATRPPTPTVNAIPAQRLWTGLQPAVSCKTPLMAYSDQLALHCIDKHGVALRVKLDGAPGAAPLVHGPGPCNELPFASVLTIVFPGTEKQPADVRMVLIGQSLPIEPSDDVHLFRRELRGLQLVELSVADRSRALGLFY